MSTWYITRKDLLLLLKDKRAVVLLLILPLLFISIVGMSTGQFLTRDDASQRFRILTVDQNNSELSQRLLKALGRHHELIVVATTESEGRKALQRGDASMLLIIGPEFESRAEELRIADVFNTDSGPLAQGPAALDLKVENRPVSIGLGRLLEGLVYSQAIKVIAPVAARKNPVTRTWVRDDTDRDHDEGSDASETNPGSRSPKSTAAVYSWIVPGFTVMFAFFVISVMARSFIAERDNGTLRRLILAPVNRVEVLAGKTIPFYLTSVLQCSMLFVCGRILFGMSWGTAPIYLVPVILCTSLAATTLGLLLATIVHTDQQVSSYGTTLILVLSSLSGCFFPREMFPQMMKRISLFTPHGWALRAFDVALTHPTVEPATIAVCCGMLCLFAVTFFAAGYWRFRSCN